MADEQALAVLSQSDIDEIWKQTEFLSAQTPLELRQAVVALNNLDGNPVEQQKLFTRIMLSQLMDMRAALTRDESKFAHLVAGAETIVDTLQKINPLQRRLDRMEAMLGSISDQLDMMAAKPAATVVEGGDVNLDAGDALLVEEKYDACIGSSWDKSNPRKAPAPVAEASATAKDAEARWDSFREGIVKKL